MNTVEEIPMCRLPRVQVEGNFTIKVIRADVSIAEARAVIAEAMKKDPDFRYAYVANIAGLLHGPPCYWNQRSQNDCNQKASEIVDLIFG